MKIFIVEDDVVIRTELAKLLEAYGYKCEYSDDFEHILSHIYKAEPDLVLLDINLPYYDGFQLCRDIRQESNISIIMVTSRNSDMDELLSMNLGADDFITKPYNKQVLLAHIQAVLRRRSESMVVDKEKDQDAMNYGGVTLELGKAIVSYQGHEMELTKNEMKILAVLMQQSGQIVSRDDLMEELWQSDEFVDDNTLTVNVNRLRHKLEELGVEGYIKTKRGLGYML